MKRIFLLSLILASLFASAQDQYKPEINGCILEIIYNPESPDYIKYSFLLPQLRWTTKNTYNFTLFDDESVLNYRIDEIDGYTDNDDFWSDLSIAVDACLALGGGDTANIYNSDGAITDLIRTVTHAGGLLHFDLGGQYRVTADGGLQLQSFTSLDILQNSGNPLGKIRIANQSGSGSIEVEASKSLILETKEQDIEILSGSASATGGNVIIEADPDGGFFNAGGDVLIYSGQVASGDIVLTAGATFPPLASGNVAINADTIFTISDEYQIATTSNEGVIFNGTGTKVATFNGDIDVTGVIDPTGLQLTPQATNPADNATIWVNSANGRAYRGNVDLEAGGIALVECPIDPVDSTFNANHTTISFSQAVTNLALALAGIPLAYTNPVPDNDVLEFVDGSSLILADGIPTPEVRIHGEYFDFTSIDTCDRCDLVSIDAYVWYDSTSYIDNGGGDTTRPIMLMNWYGTALEDSAVILSDPDGYFNPPPVFNQYFYYPLYPAPFNFQTVPLPPAPIAPTDLSNVDSVGVFIAVGGNNPYTEINAIYLDVVLSCDSSTVQCITFNQVTGEYDLTDCGGAGGINLYENDGTLTGNRIVDGGGNDFQINNTSTNTITSFAQSPAGTTQNIIQSISNSSDNTAFISTYTGDSPDYSQVSLEIFDVSQNVATDFKVLAGGTSKEVQRSGRSIVGYESIDNIFDYQNQKDVIADDIRDLEVYNANDDVGFLRIYNSNNLTGQSNYTVAVDTASIISFQHDNSGVGQYITSFVSQGKVDKLDRNTTLILGSGVATDGKATNGKEADFATIFQVAIADSQAFDYTTVNTVGLYNPSDDPDQARIAHVIGTKTGNSTLDTNRYTIQDFDGFQFWKTDGDVPFQFASELLYVLPWETGTAGQVLALPSSGKVLEWVSPTGANIYSIDGTITDPVRNVVLDNSILRYGFSNNPSKIEKISTSGFAEERRDFQDNGAVNQSLQTWASNTNWQATQFNNALGTLQTISNNSNRIGLFNDANALNNLQHNITVEQDKIQNQVQHNPTGTQGNFVQEWTGSEVRMIYSAGVGGATSVFDFRANNARFDVPMTLTSVPAYADDADAGVNGLNAGDVYQTDGTGANPLNVAGILMIKQ